MKSFVVKNNWSLDIGCGWGNGYVAIPPEHSWHGVDYDAIPTDVHGGLTWSSLGTKFERLPDDVPEDWWVIGFDTAHYGDNKDNCDKEYVEKETKHLLEQIINLDRSPFTEIRLVADCPFCNTANDVTNSVGEFFKDTHSVECDKCKNKFYFNA